MKLESQRMLPCAKGLMRGNLRRRQQTRSGRHVKRIPMPMQNGCSLQMAERRQAPGLRQGYAPPPYFPGRTGINPGAEGMGHHLSAKADAQQRQLTLQTHADQIQLRLQIGIPFHIPHPHGTAQHYATISPQPLLNGRIRSACLDVPDLKTPAPEKGLQRAKIFKSHMAKGQAGTGVGTATHGNGGMDRNRNIEKNPPGKAFYRVPSAFPGQWKSQRGGNLRHISKRALRRTA